MVRDYEMRSSCHIIEEAWCLSYPLHLTASISSTILHDILLCQIGQGMVTFGKSTVKEILP